MKGKNIVLRALLLVFALAVMSGGCGGGSEPDIDFHSLSGTWEPDSGSGTASGGGYSFRIQLSNPPGSTTFEVLNVAEKDAAIEIDAAINWDIYHQGLHFDLVQLGLSGKQKIVVERIGQNSFRFVTLDWTTIRAIFTSETTLDVEESGIHEDPEIGPINYNVKYSMTKENSEPPEDEEERTSD